MFIFRRGHNKAQEVSITPPATKLGEQDAGIQALSARIRKKQKHKSEPASLGGRVSPTPSDSGNEHSDGGSVQSLDLENVYPNNKIDEGVAVDTPQVPRYDPMEGAEEVDEEAEELFGDAQKHGGDERKKGELSFKSDAPEATHKPKKKKAKSAVKASTKATPAPVVTQEAVEGRKLEAVGKFSALWKSPSSFVYEEGVGLRKATRYERFTNIFSGVLWGRTAAGVARDVLMEKMGDKFHISSQQVGKFLGHFSQGAKAARTNSSLLEVARDYVSFQGKLARRFLGMQ